MQDFLWELTIHCEGELIAKLRRNAEPRPENMQRHGLHRVDIDHVAFNDLSLQVDLEDDSGFIGKTLVFIICQANFGTLLLFH